MTDQTPLPLSNLFEAATGKMNQAHDFAFVASDGSALFLRRAGASAPARIIQRGDSVPGVPGSWFSSISTPIFMTEPRPGPQPGMVVFTAGFYVSGSSRSGIFAYDGTTIRTLVLSTDTAPGSGGLAFTSLQLLGANDSGDIAFRALTATTAEALFILPAGGTPLRVLGKGDTLPGTAGPVSGFSLPASLNARGEIAFTCSISGWYGQIIVVGSKSGIRKVVSTGDPKPGGGTFADLSSPSYSSSPLLLNNTGVVVFQSDSNSQTWINTPNIGTERIFGSGYPLAVNDAGQVLVSAGALVRINADRTVETMAGVGQIAPGTSGDTFVSFNGAMNNSGDVAFVGSASGYKVLGVFQKSGADELKAVALNGAPAGVAGGILDIPNSSLTILDDGSVQFSANVAGGTDDSAQLLSTASGLQTLVSTADPLPAGARVSFNGNISAAGDYVGFIAQFNGGRSTFFLQNTATGAITPVVTRGDSMPGGSGRLRLVGLSQYFVNSSGQVALFAKVTEDGSQTGPLGLFLSDPARGLQKIALPGDIETTSGMRIGTISSPGIWRSGSPLNSKGQVVFAASLSDSEKRRDGLLVGSIDEGLKKVIFDYDPLPGGGTFPRISLWNLKSFLLNDAGRVAFSTWNLATSSQDSIFTALPGEPPARVVKYGDSGPSGPLYSVSEPLAFNDNGQVVFSAETGSSSGLFLGSAGSSLQAIALQGQPVPGEDGISFGPFLLPLSIGYNGGATNNAGTVVFPAQLSGSSGSGLVLRSGADSSLKPIYLQGQTVPGTSDIFGPVPYSLYFGLDNSGFVYGLTGVGDTNSGLIRYRPNGVLEKVVVTGEIAPDGGGTIVSIHPPLYNSAVSKPPFWVGVVGGTISEAIYVPLLPALQTSTSSLSFTSVDGANPETQSLTISNAGVEDLNWTATISDSWISLDAISGSAPSTVRVSADASGLSLGAHHGRITLTCGAADGSPKTLDVTFTVQSQPVLTWSTPSSIAYGTPLSATQLSATASVPGRFTYTPEAGTVLGAGGHTLSVTFSPTDTARYTTATGTVELTVNKATPTIHWPTPADITLGTALGLEQLNATADIPGTFVYAPAAGTVLGTGTHALSVTFAPTDTTNYITSAQEVRLTVNKVPPGINWTTPAAITYGQALSEAQLNATANVAGTFAYTPHAGTVLGAGTQTLSVTFTPADSNTYATATRTVSLSVNKAQPVVAWATPAAITYGTALSEAQLSATANVAGTFAYTPVAGTVLGAGTQTLSVTFTPADAANYTVASRAVQLTVNKATPGIHWAVPSYITSGTALGDSQLNATADVPGTFGYTPSKGTLLDAGSQTLSVRFVPTDATNYTEATASVSLKVNAPEVLTPVITGLTPALIKAGSSGFNLVVSGTGFGAGATVLWNGSARATTSTSGGLQAEITAADLASPGTVNITVANPASLGGGVSARFLFVIDTAATGSGGFTVTVPTAVAVEPGKDTQVPVTLAAVSSGTTVTATCLNLPAGVSCSYQNGVLTFTTSPSTPRGTYTITATFTATSQTTAMNGGTHGHFALWLGFGGLPFGLLWAGAGCRKVVRRCAIVLGGFLLVLLLAGCGGGSTANNQPGNPTPPTTPVSRQSSVVMTLTVG